ncbi:MAG: tRNA ((37)-N6)-threonylcarbamoyltransferase complex dimerization subunit type 1 TsaB [Verrucomicrobiota bacterium]|jgi:tRNA threonylcarbamoyl adenosine modification protein YeaZ
MILALETSTSRGSIALLDGDRLLLDEVFPCDRSQGSDLYRMLERAKEMAGVFKTIAVGIGPGSYAGVRISIASALGLALASGAELVGLASVAAIETDATEYLAIGDARRDTYYYSRVKDGVCVEAPQLLDAAALAGRLGELPELPVFSTTHLTGFPRAEVALPRAAILARLACAGRGILARGDFEPLYLREPHITQPKSQS